MSIKLPDGTVIAGFKPNDKIPLYTSGGTMKGPLILADDPTSELEAVPKRYIDTKIGDIGDAADVATFVKKKISDAISWGKF